MGHGLKAEERVRGIGARKKEAKGVGVKLTEGGEENDNMAERSPVTTFILFFYLTFLYTRLKIFW